MATTADHPKATIPIPDSAFNQPTPEQRAMLDLVADLVARSSNAMIDGCNWLWTNDPQSPHKVPPS